MAIGLERLRLRTNSIGHNYAAVLLTLFYGLALFGWLSLPRGRGRTAWALTAVAVFGLFAYFAPKNVRMLDGLRLRSTREGHFYRDLRRLQMRLRRFY